MSALAGFPRRNEWDAYGDIYLAVVLSRHPAAVYSRGRDSSVIAVKNDLSFQYRRTSPRTRVNNVYRIHSAKA